MKLALIRLSAVAPSFSLLVLLLFGVLAPCSAGAQQSSDIAELAQLKGPDRLKRLIDGANRWQILVKIVLPLAVPGLISAGIFAFTLSWNEFISALTFVSSSENKTVPVGVVTELVEGDVYHWGPLMAGALLGSLPVAFVYSFFVEYYVSGMTGSVKE